MSLTALDKLQLLPIGGVLCWSKSRPCYPHRYRCPQRPHTLSIIRCYSFELTGEPLYDVSAPLSAATAVTSQCSFFTWFVLDGTLEILTLVEMLLMLADILVVKFFVKILDNWAHVRHQSLQR